MSMQWDMGTAPANSLFTEWDEKMTRVKIKARAPCLMNESFFSGTFKVSAVVVHLPSPVLKLSDLALLKIVPVSTGKAIFPSLMVVVSLFSHEVVSDSLWPHGLQHARLPCPALSPGVCPFMFRFMSIELMIPSISSSVFPFSSCPQSFLASGSFQMSRFFTSGDQRVGVSAAASVLPMNIQGWFPLGLTGLISLLSRDSEESSPNTIVWKYHFFST